MTKEFCDKCGIEVSTNSTGKVEVTPGYVGDKTLCAKCWKAWGEVVKKFFIRYDYKPEPRFLVEKKPNPQVKPVRVR